MWSVDGRKKGFSPTPVASRYIKTYRSRKKGPRVWANRSGRYRQKLGFIRTSIKVRTDQRSFYLHLVGMHSIMSHAFDGIFGFLTTTEWLVISLWYFFSNDGENGKFLQEGLVVHLPVRLALIFTVHIPSDVILAHPWTPSLQPIRRSAQSSPFVAFSSGIPTPSNATPTHNQCKTDPRSFRT